jgi:hypothetical protein
VLQTKQTFRCQKGLVQIFLIFTLSEVLRCRQLYILSNSFNSRSVYLVSSAFHKDCKRTTLGREYTGTINTTRHNYPCLPWGRFRYLSEKQFPEHSRTAAKNYCRNPRNRLKGPWCYVKLNGRIYFDYCKIPDCSKLFLNKDQFKNIDPFPSFQRPQIVAM